MKKLVLAVLLILPLLNASAQWLSNSSGIQYSGGNVGIGVTLPSHRLDVLGNTRLGGNLFLGGLENNYYLKIASNEWPEIRYQTPTDDGVIRMGVTTEASNQFALGDWYVYSAAVNRTDFVVPKAGGVHLGVTGGTIGIGTRTPEQNQKLHVIGPAKFGSIAGNNNFITIAASQYPELRYQSSTDDGIMRLGIAGAGRSDISSGDFYIYSDQVKQMGLTVPKAGGVNLVPASGTVGVGTSTPNPASGVHMFKDRYTLYGPNSGWNAYLQVGGNGRATAHASVVATNGNLHLDAADGTFATYINYYNKGNTLLNVQGGVVGVGTENPNPASGVHMFKDKYTLYGPNSGWNAYLQVGGNGRATSYASVVATNGNLHLDAADGNYTTYINYYNKGNTLINSQGGNVAIGTTNIAPEFRLSVNGKIRANEIKVYTGWADYVFEPLYRLRSLTEVESYIKENKHLPDVPSAQVVEKEGINVGEMNATLLRKIEELTLYLIELDKKVKILENENKILKNKK